MSQTFFWYDLETTGIDCREGRIMQFAGQRTDMDLQPVGEPVNVLLKLSDDVLPDPDAVMITGITPQSTLQDGLTEFEFLKMFSKEVATPDTIFIGYNTVRFDDEFMRCLHYRNFYDPYEWEWRDGRGRWDLLDLVRMTRALRPDGIKWPMTEDGKPTNRLELLTKANGLDHEQAHDALSDVTASIAVAQLIKDKQPKLFDWLLNLRDKKAVKNFLATNPTCLYSSGKYPNETEKTAAVQVLHTDDSKGAIVYDLRIDPTEFLPLSAEELVERWRYTKDSGAPPRLPAKSIKYNHCPALSPLGPLSDAGVQERLRVTPETVQKHLNILKTAPDFIANVVRARDLMDDERAERWSRDAPEAEAAIYNGFFNDGDRRLMTEVQRIKDPSEITDDLAQRFHDARLQAMLPRYKARNFPDRLSSEERQAWEAYRQRILLDGGNDSRLMRYMNRLSELAKTAGSDKGFLLEELQLYAESIVPAVYDEETADQT